MHASATEKRPFDSIFFSLRCMPGDDVQTGADVPCASAPNYESQVGFGVFM